MKSDKILVKADSSLVEHRQKVMKGLIAQMPVIGSILTEYLPDYKSRRMEAFLRLLKNDLDKLKISLDEEYIKRDDVVCLVERSIKSALETYDEAKIIALKNGTLNILNKKDIDSDRKELYLNILNALTPFHLKMLYVFYQTELYLRETGIEIPKNMQSGRATFIKIALPEMSDEEIKLVYSDLVSKGLVQEIGINGLSSSSGIDALKGFENRFGKQFMDFFSYNTTVF